MRDIYGKILNIGSEIYTHEFGLCKIIGSQTENILGEPLNEDIIVATTLNDKEVRLRTNTDKVVNVRSWKEMAKTAIQVQDACNLSGVVHAFSTIISEVRYRLESENNGGTNNINSHPVCVLFSDKISHLTNTQNVNSDAFSQAYNWAYDQIKK